MIDHRLFSNPVQRRHMIQLLCSFEYVKAILDNYHSPAIVLVVLQNFIQTDSVAPSESLFEPDHCAFHRVDLGCILGPPKSKVGRDNLDAPPWSRQDIRRLRCRGEVFEMRKN